MILPERNSKLVTVLTDSAVKRYISIGLDFIKNNNYGEALVSIRAARTKIADSPTLAAYEAGCIALQNGNYKTALDTFVNSYKQEQNPEIAGYVRAAAVKAYMLHVKYDI